MELKKKSLMYGEIFRYRGKQTDKWAVCERTDNTYKGFQNYILKM